MKWTLAFVVGLAGGVGLTVRHLLRAAARTYPS